MIGRTAARLARQVDVALATVDLSAAQYRMLFQLAEGAEASTTLARKLEVSAPSVTAVVDGLVQRGIVERTHSEEDRRRVSLRLTERGRTVLTAADEAVCERLSTIAGLLDEHDPVNPSLVDLGRWSQSLDAHRSERLARRVPGGDPAAGDGALEELVGVAPTEVLAVKAGRA